MARRKAEERAKREEEAQRQAEELKKMREEEERRQEEERCRREREEAARLQKQVREEPLFSFSNLSDQDSSTHLLMFVQQKEEEESRQREEAERLRQERERHFQKQEAERMERKKVSHSQPTVCNVPYTVPHERFSFFSAPGGDHEENQALRASREGTSWINAASDWLRNTFVVVSSFLFCALPFLESCSQQEWRQCR